jgi:hydrogenase/urease accessory protein HupE
MIVDDNLNNEIDKKVSKGMKPGFFAGLVAFLLAKISHLLVTFAIGLWVAVATGGNITRGWWSFIEVVDSVWVGLFYLIFVTRFIYLKITR